MTPFASQWKIARVRATLFLVVLLMAIAALSADASRTLPEVQKVFLPPRLLSGDTGIQRVQPIDDAAWIWYPEAKPDPSIKFVDVFNNGWRQPTLLRFRREFVASAAPLRIDVSGDERFELFLDDQRIARGPDRSDVEHWSYATYDVRLSPGKHRLEALVWSIGPYEPVAQLTWRGGFILKAEGRYDRQLTTGKAPWEVAKLDGYDFVPSGTYVGAELIAHDCGAQWKQGDYVPAQVVRAAIKGDSYGESAPGWKLFPTRLPDQIDREFTTGRAMALGEGALGSDDVIKEAQAQNPQLPEWQGLIDGSNEVVVPANTKLFLLWDLGNYYCAYPECEVSGGQGATLNGVGRSRFTCPIQRPKGSVTSLSENHFAVSRIHSCPAAARIRNSPRCGGGPAVGVCFQSKRATSR